MAASRPLVGVAVGAILEHTGLPYFGLNRRYVLALQRAGADVVLLPSGDPGAGSALLGRLDGLLLPGGLDVHPRFYGEEPTPVLGRVNEELDELELALINEAVNRGLPTLGICRGHQMVNVALGGSLHQDVNAAGLTGREHFASVERGRDRLVHWVDVLPGTVLEEVVGLRRLHVNSFHHQSIKVVAAGLKVNTLSTDGVIEGLESEDGRVLTLQCHPEELTAHPWARDLFSAFVEAAAAQSTFAAPSARATAGVA
ncbi:MAG: gamma-glutamyl-gamma-aminobutyrate hydrolase family protein [Candidatus Dormibacteraeota bacterium]|nr:gamma-glutamyl-gamma-aminobutyrate hydrolase family protein [Candidatus Dormibacteraeota bacterium]